MKPAVLLNLLDTKVVAGLIEMDPFIDTLTTRHPVFVLSRAGEVETQDMLEDAGTGFDGILLDGSVEAGLLELERLGYGPVMVLDIGEDGE